MHFLEQLSPVERLFELPAPEEAIFA